MITRIKRAHEQPTCERVAMVSTPLGVVYVSCDYAVRSEHITAFVRRSEGDADDVVVATVPSFTAFFMITRDEVEFVTEEDAFEEQLDDAQRHKLYRERADKILGRADDDVR